MAATSFFLASFTPKTLTLGLSKPQTLLLPSSLSSFSSVALPSSERFEPLLSPFARNVAVSSDYEQQEEFLNEDEEVPNFSPDLKLFAGNLPFSVDSAELADLFGNAGTVQLVEEFEGRQLRVNSGPPPPRESTPRSSRGGPSFENNNRVHVGNLSWQVDDSALKTLFSELGDVLEAKVIYDRDSGCSRGFGLGTYGSADEVNNAIESLDGVDLNGRPIRVTMAEARQRRQF